jgi:FdrA protein
VTARLVVRRNTYHDSVSLMVAARDAEALPGVSFAAAAMATPVNVELLEGQGFEPEQDLGPNDMVVAIRADDETAADAAVGLVEHALSAAPSASEPRADAPEVRSPRAARRVHPELNLAFVSVPGHYATYEVAAALEAGMHVFCFSDGVGIEEEAILKRRAAARGLLLMGADCGTAVLNGVGLGFANVLRSGPVGVVGASGTGMQQVTCLLDRAGIGVSQAIGVGGRDLTATVGATVTLQALELLASEEATEVIALISKAPDREVAERVIDAAARAGKPVVAGFLGPPLELASKRGVQVTTSLEATAARCAELCGRGPLDLHDADPPERRTRGAVRGFFCGGSLCQEVAALAAQRSPGAVFVDYGDDEYTQGRAHPMIDPTLRNERFERDAADGSVGAIVLDVVLGRGAHPDAAGDLTTPIQRALAARDGALTIVVALCGSAGDPQGVDDQEGKLRRAGAVVTRNAAHAARLALAATGVTR